MPMHSTLLQQPQAGLQGPYSLCGLQQWLREGRDSHCPVTAPYFAMGFLGLSSLSSAINSILHPSPQPNLTRLIGWQS